METETILLETSLSLKEISTKLNAITITDFSSLRNSPEAVYYGVIKNNMFDIKNVRYGPMSHAPGMQGEIEEDSVKTTIKLTMDINAPYKITRNMYYGTLLPIGILAFLLSLLVLGGTDFQLQGYLFSSAFIVCAFLVVAIEKISLVNTRKREVKDFAARIDAHIKTSEETITNNSVSNSNNSFGFPPMGESLSH